MVETSIPPGVSPLAGIANVGQRLGRRDGAAGVTIAEVTGLAIASVSARSGQRAALLVKVETQLGLALPSQPKSVSAGTVNAVWSGPDQWLVVFGTGGRARVADLAGALTGLASVTDQSDSRAVLEISGPHTRDVLAKGVMLDLHPRAFVPGDTAVTLVAHIGAQVTMTDPAPVYQLIVPRSFCVSFWDWLVSSAEEYGIAVQAKVSTKTD